MGRSNVVMVVVGIDYSEYMLPIHSVTHSLHGGMAGGVNLRLVSAPMPVSSVPVRPCVCPSVRQSVCPSARLCVASAGRPSVLPRHSSLKAPANSTRLSPLLRRLSHPALRARPPGWTSTASPALCQRVSVRLGLASQPVCSRNIEAENTST